MIQKILALQGVPVALCGQVPCLSLHCYVKLMISDIDCAPVTHSAVPETQKHHGSRLTCFQKGLELVVMIKIVKLVHLDSF